MKQYELDFNRLAEAGPDDARADAGGGREQTGGEGLEPAVPGDDTPGYLSEQLITYIGNKRSLLPLIARGVDAAMRRLAVAEPVMADLFSGSGVVARLFKRYAGALIVNDLEPYAEIINRCYLANRDELDERELRSAYEELRTQLGRGLDRDGIIASRYAPQDDSAIRAGERVFYTTRNARYLDTARRLIGELPNRLQPLLLGPLLSEASVHANTAGVFKGFYKDRETGIGRFGGTNGDAVTRITGDIELRLPLLSRYSRPVEVYRDDANTVVGSLPELDIAYLDPPYNQHPYGSNYFMLNLLTEYREPQRISRVSGIPDDWRRSAYNSRARALSALTDLTERTPAKVILISFNSEGFITHDELKTMLSRFGRLEVFAQRYNTFRGSRNLRNRSIHVTEYLFLLERR